MYLESHGDDTKYIMSTRRNKYEEGTRTGLQLG